MERSSSPAIDTKICGRDCQHDFLFSFFLNDITILVQTFTYQPSEMYSLYTKIFPHLELGRLILTTTFKLLTGENETHYMSTIYGARVIFSGVTMMHKLNLDSLFMTLSPSFSLSLETTFIHGHCIVIVTSHLLVNGKCI